MDYKLGLVGFGHWFNRLNVGIQKVGGLSLSKVVGTKPYSEKSHVLEGFGIGDSRYYIAEKDGSIPPTFFDGIDVVHISDPNKYHAGQSIDSLSHGKYVVVEKSLAVDERQFNEVSAFIRSNKLEDRVYLHLHYLHKQPTLEMRKAIPELVSRYGQIIGVKGTFFEKESGEDSKRTWIFGMESGGLFMDWIHPFEILYHATGSRFGSISELSLYQVKEAYDSANPTGINAVVRLQGRHYKEGATASISVAKGVRPEFDSKFIIFQFESGVQARLEYVGSEREFMSDDRGSITLLDKKGFVMERRSLSGPNSSEIFVNEILDLCRGSHLGLSISEIAEIFAPQWEYQRMLPGKELIRDAPSVDMFVRGAINSANASKQQGY